MIRTLLAALALTLTVLSVQATAYTLTTIIDDLDRPWGLAFLPDGQLLITERGGALKRIDEAGTAHVIDGVPPVYFAASGQSGLFDVILDPAFSTNQTIYLAYAHGNRAANATRIARARLDGDSLSEVTPIFTVEPMKRLPQHYGGKMIFLRDGTLMLTVGEGFNYREAAQDTYNLMGKTVRINTDGSIPENNPFADGEGGHPAVWSWGHRNPQGLLVDQVTGAILLHEHGPRGGDEVNLIFPGTNYGWPAITYGIDYSGAYVSPFTEHPRMAQPVKYWTPSIAPSGFAQVDGDEFPEWEGSFLVGALVDQDVKRLSVSEDGSVEEESLFAELGSRIRDVRVAADGSIYLVTDGNPGSIVRVTAD